MKFFNLSHKKLDDLRYESLDNFQSNVIIKGIDFAEAKENNEIEYREDGVYLFKNGHWIRGYYYMKTYDIDRYGTNPRFHLFNCSVMENRALFRGNYIWANDKTVNVTNRQTRIVNEDVVLQLCSKCAEILIDDISSTQEFHDNNIHEEVIEVAKELTIFGYPMNWRKIATSFKSKNGLICNSCDYTEESQLNKWFFDVDHKNGDKQNCTEANLQVLCKLCHVYKDEHHRQQAVRFPNRNNALHEFVRRNKEALNKNKFLKEYLNDFNSY